MGRGWVEKCHVRNKEGRDKSQEINGTFCFLLCFYYIRSRCAPFESVSGLLASVVIKGHVRGTTRSGSRALLASDQQEEGLSTLKST